VRERPAAVGREAEARVEPPDLVERALLDRPGRAGEPLGRVVVEDDDDAVARPPDVRLDGVRPQADGVVEGGEGVLGGEAASAPVRDEPGAGEVEVRAARPGA
jgi:hypothetical protein